MSHDEKKREEWLKEEEIKNEIFMQQIRALAEELKKQKMNYMVNPKAVKAIDGLKKFFEEKSKKHMEKYKNTPYDSYPYVVEKPVPLVHPSMSCSYGMVVTTKDEDGFSFEKDELEEIQKLGDGLIRGVSVHAAYAPDGTPLGGTYLSIEISDFFILIPN